MNDRRLHLVPPPWRSRGGRAGAKSARQQWSVTRRSWIWQRRSSTGTRMRCRVKADKQLQVGRSNPSHGAHVLPSGLILRGTTLYLLTGPVRQ